MHVWLVMCQPGLAWPEVALAFINPRPWLEYLSRVLRSVGEVGCGGGVALELVGDLLLLRLQVGGLWVAALHAWRQRNLRHPFLWWCDRWGL
jgi:hypothetical protein